IPPLNSLTTTIIHMLTSSTQPDLYMYLQYLYEFFLVHGLFALQNCTSTADTVCDVLSGYLCKSLANNKGCMMAEEHSQCAPGQGIKQLGTSRTDNVCEDYFSQDVVACKLCSETQVKVKEGGASTDIVCSDGSRNHSMVFVLSLLFLLTFLDI
uniref:Uncharacterized protein n=1 Tax=Echeneis naucrates TaxID=173247 RepID=A0A665WZC7_ECHNA